MYDIRHSKGDTRMAGQLPDDIVQSIAISNAKSLSEQPLEASSSVGDEHVRFGDVELHIDGQGRLVVAPTSSRLPDIFVPGKFSREDVEVTFDSGRGVTLRLRNSR